MQPFTAHKSSVGTAGGVDNAGRNRRKARRQHSSCTRKDQKPLRCRVKTCAEPKDFPLTNAIFAKSKYVDLLRVEDSIKAYCKRADGEDREECYEALQNLEKQHIDAQEALKNEETAAQATKELERLDQLARGLSSSGDCKLMVQVLRHLQHKIEVSRARQNGSSAGGASSPDEDDDLVQQRRKRLRQVFDQMDHNGDGVLNIQEFRDAMDALGDHLDGRSVAEICNALGVHGRMEYYQFVDAVEVHTLSAESKEASQLRNVLHHHDNGQFMRWMKAWQR